MPDASLQAVVGADVQGFVTGMKTAETASNSLQSSIKKLDETFAVENNTLNRSSGYMKQQADAAAKLAQSQLQVAGSATTASTGIAEVGVASAGIIPSVNAAYGAIRKLAFVLPGIGIAGLFNLAFEGIASAFSSATKEVDDATKSLEEYQKTVESVVSANAKESATVDILVGKIQSGTLSRQETVQAIKELQKIAPDYFAKLNAEKSSIEDVTRAYGAYNNQIVKTIEAQIRIAEITDLVKQRLNETAQLPDAAKFIADLQAQGKTLEEINAIVVKGVGDDIRAQALLAQTSKGITDEQSKQLLLQSKVPAGVQTILSLLQKEQDLLKQISGADISKLVELDKVKIPKVKEPEDPQKSSISFGLLLDTSNFDPIEAVKPAQKKVDKYGYLKFPIIAGVDQAAFAKALAQAEKLTKDINKVFANGIRSGIEGFGESIGDAIASGKNPIEAAGKSILVSLGDLIENIGKSLIEYGIVKEGLDQILEGGIAIPGVVALAAGAAAIAFGALVKSLASPRKAFAEGGIVTGPTNALIGEAGPEVVFPLDKLNRFIKGNTGSNQNIGVTVTGRISGRDLVFAYNNQVKYNKLAT